MVNIREPLTNVVTINKRKMLKRLNQKVSGQAQVLHHHLPQMLHHRRIGGT